MSTAVVESYDPDAAVAAEVRAMAARRMLKGRDLGAFLGEDEMWISRRMRGKVAWTAGELVKLAVLFECEPADLLPSVDPDLWGPEGVVRRQGLEPRTRWLRDTAERAHLSLVVENATVPTPFADRKVA